LHVTVTLRALPPWLPRLAQGHRQNSTGAARAQSGERLLQMRRTIKIDGELAASAPLVRGRQGPFLA